MNEYIQFIGTQRSGSNLLRLMLNAHSSVLAEHPPHLLRTFVPLVSTYGDLSKMQNRLRLVEDMIQWVSLNPVKWNKPAFDKLSIANSSRDVFDIFWYIYDSQKEVQGASKWCCKSTFNIHFAEKLEEKFHPFYIFLYRDGRDVAASFKKTIVGHKHIYVLAKQWSEEQQLATDLLKELPADRFLKVSYEELIQYPEKVLKRVCAKLGLDFESGMLEYHTSDDSIKTADSGFMWQNVTSPPISDNKRKYLRELNPREIEIFESVAKDQLLALDYRLESRGNIVFSQASIAQFEKENEALRNSIASNYDPKDIELRRPQQELLATLKSRATSSVI